MIHDPPTSTLRTLHMDLGLEPADLKDSLSWAIQIRMTLFLSLPSPVPAHEWPALCHWEYGALSLEDPQWRWRGKVNPFIRLHEASKYSTARQIVFFLVLTHPWSGFTFLFPLLCGLLLRATKTSSTGTVSPPSRGPLQLHIIRTSWLRR